MSDDGLPDPVHRHIVDRIRTHLDAIAAEMIKEVQAQIPEYARPLDPVYARTVQLAVEEALRHLVDRLAVAPGSWHAAAAPRTPDDGWRELFRAIGAGELREGRSLDALHAALRLCTRVGWRWLVDIAAAEGAALHTLGRLAEVIFSYLDQIADASAAGYGQAQAAAAGELDRRRRRLLELLLADPPASTETVAAAAEAARWRLPRRIAAVALEPRGPALEPDRHGDERRKALSTPPALNPDILVDLDRAEPCLLVPDPPPRPLRALSGWRAAVGPVVAIGDAAKSLRWARDALALARRGILHGDPVWCEDHLATLAVFRDEDLVRLLAARLLAPLDGVRQRELLADTLLAWLQSDTNATEVAARLHVHPQTVRYRLRRLDRLFGPALRDPRTHFELEIALRADRARRLSTADNDARNP
jgi:PucR C-terminal helix-turn-helix domain